jgi:XTP/dITP diphosphohydrolase
MIRTIVLASRNGGKLREIRHVLHDLPVAIKGLEDFPGVAEPEETGATFAENARQKALYYARCTGQWCLSDDSGLVVDALAGRPGVHSARYAIDDCPANSTRQIIDQANNAKLLRELLDVPADRRTARFICHLALSDGQTVLIEASDAIEGLIGYQASGDNGFGYDPLFYLPQLGCTTAQLPEAQKNIISHRGKALLKFAVQLTGYLSTGQA